MTPRKVDPYVYVMEWIFRHSSADGLTRGILLSIGRWMKWTPSGFETGPLSTKQIAEGLKIGDSTVREHLAALGGEKGDVEILKGRRRGETYRYRLRREQVLPLADLRPNLHSRMAAVTPPDYGGEPPPVYSGDTASVQRSDRQPTAVSAPNGSGDVADVSFSSELVRTKVLTTTEEQAVGAFLAWWSHAYPLYNDGAQSSPRRDDRDVVADLMVRRSLDRVRTMAVALWKVDAREEPWIATSDRSLRVLRHKADWLDLRLTKVADWWIACPHTPKCDERTQCQAQEAVG